MLNIFAKFALLRLTKLFTQTMTKQIIINLKIENSINSDCSTQQINIDKIIISPNLEEGSEYKASAYKRCQCQEKTGSPLLKKPNS